MSGRLDKPVVFRSFPGGVNTAMPADNLPAVVSPHGLNSVLVEVSGAEAIPARRLGFQPVTDTAPSAGVPIIKLVPYTWISSTGASTSYLLALSGLGPTSRLDTIVGSTIESIATSAFADTEAIPVVTCAQNVAFFCNGTDRKKVLRLADDTLAIQDWGLEPPAAPTVTHPASGEMADGVYQIALTTHNHNSGAASSLGTIATVTIALNDELVVDWSGLTLDAQVTHVRTHLIKETLTSQFFQASESPVADGHVHLDLTSAEINQLTILSPTASSAQRPPENILGSAWHLSRMFVIDNTTLYWSAVNEPEAYTRVSLPINPKDGQKNVAIVSVHESLLLILKEGSFWGLFGITPQVWELRCINPTIGCRFPHSVQVFEGKVAWWSEHGPVVWDQQGPDVLHIGKELLGALVDTPTISASYPVLSLIDTSQRLIWWFATEEGHSTPNVIFPYHARLGCWVSHRWEPMSISACCATTTSPSLIYVASPMGRLYQYGGHLDGARAGYTVTGTVTSFT